MILKVSDNFTSGTGVGTNDVRPVSVSLYQDTAKEVIDETMLIGSGISLSGITEIYEERIDFYCTPGYLYFGDRELYIYGDKITQVSHAYSSGSDIVVSLKEFPDGMRPAYLDDLYIPGFEQDLSDGASPIVLRKYQSGTLEDLGVYFDSPISSSTGYNETDWYSIRSDSGTVESQYPWLFTPLDRFSKMYEDWREDANISPALYEYDFNTNAIIIHPGEDGTFDEVDMDAEYVIEFEGSNEPFRTGLDLSPLVTYPEDSVICITPNVDISTEEISTIRLYSTENRVVGNKIVTIAAEAVSLSGNRMPQVDIDFYIQRPGLYMGAADVPDPLVGYPLFYGLNHSYDRVELPGFEVLEDSTVLASDDRIMGEAYIKGVGYLSGIAETQPEYIGYHTVATTDIMGFAHINYVTPSGGVITTSDIKVVARTANIESSIDITLLSSASNIIIADEAYENIRIVHVSGVIQNGDYAFVPVIEGCISPSSIGACKADDFVTALANDTDPVFHAPISFNEIDQNPYIGFDLYESGIPLVVRYPMQVDVTKLDGRGVYGK